MKHLILAFVFSILTYLSANAQIGAELLERAATEGDINAQRYLGEAYLTGNASTKKNLELSYKWLSRAAEQGDSEAQFVLATNEELAFIVNRSSHNQLFWLEKSATNGSAIAQHKLAWYSYEKNGRFSTTEDIENHIYWLKKASDQNYPPAVADLGSHYYIYHDYDKAFVLYKHAVEDLNDYRVCYLLGQCYESGLGCSVNKEKAFECYKKSMEAGNVYGKNSLARLLIEGHGTKQNIPLGIKYLEELIKETNFPDAYKELSSIYYQGIGVSKNIEKAIALIDKAIFSADYQGQNIFDFLDCKGTYLVENHRFDEALEVWQKLSKSSPEYCLESESIFCKTMRSMSDGNVDVNIFASNNKNSNTFVVIICNENYKRAEPVPYANNDGRIFKQYCLRTLGVPESNIQFIEDATYNDIKYSINWLSNVINAYNGNAKVIFYYAGHGIPDEKQSAAYLLPIDGYSNDVSTGYNMDELYLSLGKMPSQGVMVFLDACFSGTKREGDMMVSARGVAVKVKKATASGNMVILSASQGDETAYPFKDQQHGMFTYYLLRKLKDTKGEVSLGELSDYVISEVKKNSIVKNGKLQTPTVVSSGQIGDSWKNWTLK